MFEHFGCYNAGEVKAMFDGWEDWPQILQACRDAVPTVIKAGVYYVISLDGRQVTFTAHLPKIHRVLKEATS